MAVSIPVYPAGSTTNITYRASAADQTPTFGGPAQRVARLGDKWVYSVSMRPMAFTQARVFLAALLQGVSAKVLCPVIISGLDLTNQVDVVAANGSGKTLSFTGSNANKSVGQYFSIVGTDGVRYLHMVTASSGNTLSIIPALKRPIAGGELMEFKAPKIEGFLEGTEQTFTLSMVAAGVTFSVVEAQ